jgi:hypothetical protein
LLSKSIISIPRDIEKGGPQRRAANLARCDSNSTATRYRAQAMKTVASIRQVLAAFVRRLIVGALEQAHVQPEP